MNTDIRLSVNFWDHPKTMKLKRRLGGDGPIALLVLWCWAGKNRPDGDLSGMDDEDIELAAKWDDNRAGELVPVLVELRWLDKTETGYVLHEWQEYNPWASKSEDRADRGRFAKLAKTAPDAYSSLKAQGVTAITREDYETIVAENRPAPEMLGKVSSNSQGQISNANQNSSKIKQCLSNAKASLNGQSSNAEANLSKTTSPAPDPIPDPIPAHYAHTPPTPPDGGSARGEAGQPADSTAAKSGEAAPASQGQTEANTPAENPPNGGGARPSTDGNGVLPAEKPSDNGGGARPENPGGKEEPYPQDFEAFYAAYPRRVHKKPALKAWQTLLRQGVNAHDLTKAAETYGKVAAWKATPADKVLYPATFLHEDRWRDWLPPDGASYLEAKELAKSPKNGGNRPADAALPRSYEEALRRYGGGDPNVPKTYEEAVAKYGGGNYADAIDVEYRVTGEGENYDAGTGLQPIY